MIFLLLCIELVVYLWAVGTTEAEFVFDKCARNSGRVSSIINLGLLLIIGFYGFRKIHGDPLLKDAVRVLVTLFAVNHVVHLFYVLRNFDHHGSELDLVENLHGVLTFVCLLSAPVALWAFWRSRSWWDLILVAHLFNVSFFIMKTFQSKVKPDHPAYHNQLGVWVTATALIYVLYRLVREYRSSFAPSGIH